MQLAAVKINRCTTESDLKPRFQHVYLLHFQQEVSPVPDHHLGQLTKKKDSNEKNVKIFFILIFFSVTRISWNNAIKMVSMIITKKVNQEYFKPVIIFKNPKLYICSGGKNMTVTIK